MSHISYSYALICLAWLYIIQGIPYGLQEKFVPMQLRVHGLTYSSVGVMKLVLIPWISKGLFAPVLELAGNRGRWLLGTHIVMALTTLAVGACSVDTGVLGLGCSLLVLNAGCAVQDVLVDSIAIHVVKHTHLAAVNSMQVVMYKLGALCGGGGLLWLMTVTSWQACMALLAVLYAVAAVGSIALPLDGAAAAATAETPVIEKKELRRSENSEDRHLPSSGNVNNNSCVSLNGVISIYKEILSCSGAYWMSAYVLIHKMGERGAMNNFPLFLQDSGMSLKELAFWNGTVCQCLSILGSTFAGINSARNGSNMNRLLQYYSLLRLTALGLQCCCIYSMDSSTDITQQVPLYWCSLMSLCLVSYTGGVLTSLTFTFLMQYSRTQHHQPAVQSSHYSVLSSLEVAGKLLFASVAGFVVDWVGLNWAFIFYASLSTLPMILLLFEPISSVKNKKE